MATPIERDVQAQRPASLQAAAQRQLGATESRGTSELMTGPELAAACFDGACVVLNLITGRLFSVPSNLKVGLKCIVLGEPLVEAERALSESLALARYVVRERLRNLKRDLLAEHSHARPTAEDTHRDCGKVHTHHLATAPIVYPAMYFNKSPGSDLLLLPESAAVASELRRNPSRRCVREQLMRERLPEEVWLVRGFSASGIGIVLEAQSPEEHLIARLAMLGSRHSPETWRRELESLAAGVARTSNYAALMPQNQPWKAIEAMYPVP
jgi:hypothetical protein